MTRRDAFARARAFLDFLPAAKWSAIAAGLAAGLAGLVLLSFLVFLADLLIHQGRIPDLADLTPSQRQAHSTPAVWRESAAGLLRDRVGEAAASRYLAAPDDPHGLLGLVVRWRDHWLGVPLGWLARVAPGLWQIGGPQANLIYLLRLGVLVGVSFLLLMACELINALAATRAAGEAGTRLRRAIYQHTYRRGSLAIREQGPAEAVSLFTRQVEMVQDGLLAWLLAVGRPFVLLALGIFLVVAAPWMAGAFAFLLLAVLGLQARAAAAQNRREQAAVQKAAQQIALMQETLRMLRLVKCYLMDLVSQQRMDRQLLAYARQDSRRRVAERLQGAFQVFLIGLAALIWLLWATWLVLTGRQDVVQLIAANLAGVGLALACADWRRRQPAMQRGKQAADLLFEFLDQPSDVTQDAGAETLPPLAKQIEFDHLSMREPGGSRMLLEDISLRLPAGRRLGIVGPDDREKHALACLLPRFVDPTSGEIRFDEHNLRWVSLESLRGQIGLVLRHNLVFNDTVLQNIGCGSATARLPQITEAAKLAHAHHFIQKLPKGYDTVIGELGHRLDVGEQYRIALARAILRQPSLLVIEEPLSSDLDNDTLSLLDDTYNRILAGRTVVFLPHRLATLRSCDHLILLHHGRIEAAGSHRDLLAGSEYYQHLHYLEFNPHGDSP